VFTARYVYVLRSAHTVHLCILCGSENKQRLFPCTAFTDWLVFITETECLLRGTFYILRSAHTVHLCVLCGSENKQRLFPCTALTDWLVFITETECVYCAVRSTFYVLPTLCIYVFCLDLRTNSEYFTVQH